MSSNVKSLVWYSPKAFADDGYTVPTTWDELMALSDKIAKAGKAKPWCGGIGSGTATGWPATDWLEEVVLREDGADVYDKWISHEVKFNSPEIIKAHGHGRRLDARTRQWVNGGFGDVKTIATTTFQDAGKPILDRQVLHAAAGVVLRAQWPEGTKVGRGRRRLRVLPAGDRPSYGKPVVGGGEFVTAFADRPEVQAVQTYLVHAGVGDQPGQGRAGWVSANNGRRPEPSTPTRSTSCRRST